MQNDNDNFNAAHTHTHTVEHEIQASYYYRLFSFILYNNPVIGKMFNITHNVEHNKRMIKCFYCNFMSRIPVIRLKSSVGRNVSGMVMDRDQNARNGRMGWDGVCRVSCV